MKRAILVTWFNYGRNYGQTLQAYALQTKLKEFEVDAQLLYFGFEVYNSIPLLNDIYHIFKQEKSKWLIQYKFNKFVNKYLNISKPLRRTKYILNYLDSYKPELLICGSDQIWNPYNLYPIYYLNGIGCDNCERISYGVSLCNPKYKNKFKEQPLVKDWLNKFKAISVRENTGKDIIKELFNLESEVVLDPTLLFTGEEWCKLFNLNINNTKSKSKYILCYCFNISEKEKVFIEQRAKLLNARVEYGNILLNNEIKTEAWSPIDFVDKIRNAEEIITDSFHGTVFSILFHKNFWIFDNGKAKDSNPFCNIDRMNTLLGKINLSNRILDDNLICRETIIDYNQVDSVLNIERKRSLEFLKKHI